MDSIYIRETVENYKKMQLYSVDCCTVEDSIITDLMQEVNNRSILYPDEFWKISVLAKIISYLEFGLPYEKYMHLFDKTLFLCQIDEKFLQNVVNPKAQYVKLSKRNLQKIVIWKTGNKHNYRNKGDVIQDMLSSVRKKQYGNYLFETDKSGYQLSIEPSKTILKNVPKEISYYLI